MDLIRTTKTTSHGRMYRFAFAAVTKTQEKESAESHPSLPALSYLFIPLRCST